MRRWACGLARRDHSPAVGALLSLFRRGSALDMASTLSGLMVRLTIGPSLICGHLLQGLCRLVSLHIL